MKNFRVTVNGNPYDVAVEEVGGAAPSASPTVPAAPVSAPPASGFRLEAPMPGTILDIKVASGQKVEKNQVVVTLEAMKMENEIVAPQAGTVGSVAVSKGQSVNSGDLIMTIS
ncbi:MAG: biotin/lipoyl-binding protein [Clostridiales bacterium]|nr:biotin/lipoyl-binding protein [Clostridiales bacterium]